MRGKTTPAPLVLQFLKDILGIGPVSVELPHAAYLVVGVAHQGRALEAGNALAGFAISLEECQHLLTVILVFDDDFAHQRSAQHDYTALFQCRHQWIIAEGVVTAHQFGLAPRRQVIEVCAIRRYCAPNAAIGATGWGSQAPGT